MLRCTPISYLVTKLSKLSRVPRAPMHERPRKVILRTSAKRRSEKFAAFSSEPQQSHNGHGRSLSIDLDGLVSQREALREVDCYGPGGLRSRLSPLPGGRPKVPRMGFGGA